jgi:hypothetical protein
MKKVIFIFLVLLLAGTLILYIYKQVLINTNQPSNNKIEVNDYCESDLDCGIESVCPYICINKKNTHPAELRCPEPIPRCICINNKCTKTKK